MYKNQYTIDLLRKLKKSLKSVTIGFIRPSAKVVQEAKIG